MGIGDPAVRKPNSSVQSVPTYVRLYYSKFRFQKSTDHVFKPNKILCFEVLVRTVVSINIK